MVKLSGFIGRKVPIPGVAFSSQSCSAGMEVELSDTESTEAIRERLRGLYALLREAIAEQLASGDPIPVALPAPPASDTGALPAAAPTVPPVSGPVAPPESPSLSSSVRLPSLRLSAAQSSPTPPDGNGNGNGNGSGNGNGNGNGNGDGNGNDEEPRTRATRAQQRAIHAICRNLDLDPTLLLLDYGVVSVADLTIKDASRLIDDLKFRQANDLACG